MTKQPAAAVEIDDQDDWIDLEPKARVGIRAPDVTATVSKKHHDRAARAFISFRREAAEWFGRATRFRVQIGGPAANKVRFLPDNVAGRYEIGDTRLGAAKIMRLGIRPDDARPVTAAHCEIRGDAFVVTLPEHWAKRRMSPKPPPPPAVPKPEPRAAFRLRQKDEEERAQVAEVPAAIGSQRFTKIERAMLRLLVNRDLVTKAAFLAATASTNDPDDDEHEKLTDFVACKLRPNLRALGLEMETVWGEGYRLAVDQRRSLRMMFNAAEHRPNGSAAALLGDPPPGRSALDQARARR